MGSESSLIKKGGDKPISMDFAEFKHKSIIKDASQQQLEITLGKLKAVEQKLKKYKYSEDFDRMQRIDAPSPLSQTGYQNLGIWSLGLGIYVAKVYTNFYYRSKHSNYVTVRLILPFTLFFLFLGNFAFQGIKRSHLINGPEFQSIQPDMRMFRSFDQQMNLYKYVDDIKYNFDYSDSDIKEIKKNYFKRRSDDLDQNIIQTMKQRYEDHEKFIK